MKKIISCISIACLAIGFAVQAQNYTLNQGDLINKNFVDSISLEFESMKIIIPVEINGKIRRFMLDTGAPLVISKELQQELGIVGNKRIIRDINEKRDSTDYITLPSLKIGSVEYRNTNGVAMDLRSGLFGCFRIDGIIGSNLLRNTIIQINTKSKKIILTDNPELIKIKPNKGIEMKLNAQSTPIIKVYLTNKSREELIFDSGADSFYSLCMRNFKYFMEKTDIKDFIIDKGRGATNTGMLGLEDDTVKHLLRLKKFWIDKMSFANILVSTDVSNNSRVGAELFEYAIVTIDYINKKFYVDPFVKGKFDINVNNHSYGFELKPDNDLIKVGLVWEKSDAFQKGIRSNDILKQINDFSLAGKSLCELFFKLYGLHNHSETINLVFEDMQGNEKKIVLEKK